MNIEVMPAVITVIRPIDTSITTEATNRPTPDVGVLSPKPTVVTIWSVNQSASPNVAYSSGASSLIGSAPARTSVMMVLMIAAAA